MATQDYGRMIKDYYDAFNQRDYNKLLDFMADDADVELNAFNKKFHGKSEIKNSMERWIKAFPDMRVDVSNVYVSDQGVAVELIGRGTHKGSFSSPSGDISPTGKSVELKGCEIFKVKDGKVASIHSYYDSGSMLRQLGIKGVSAAA